MTDQIDNLPEDERDLGIVARKAELEFEPIGDDGNPEAIQETATQWKERAAAIFDKVEKSGLTWLKGKALKEVGQAAEAFAIAERLVADASELRESAFLAAEKQRQDLQQEKLDREQDRAHRQAKHDAEMARQKLDLWEHALNLVERLRDLGMDDLVIQEIVSGQVSGRFPGFSGGGAARATEAGE